MVFDCLVGRSYYRVVQGICYDYNIIPPPRTRGSVKNHLPSPTRAFPYSEIVTLIPLENEPSRDSIGKFDSIRV